jgi:hypothetical protein
MKITSMILAALVAITPTVATAQYYGGQHYGHGQRYDDRRGYRGYDRGYNNHRYDRYDRRDYRYNDRRCRDGSTGTVLGAIAGGLLGRTVDTRGDRTAGTVIGGLGGGLAGRAIDRNCR